MRYNRAMEEYAVKKRGLAAIWALAPVAHGLALLSGGLILLFELLKGNRPLMQALSAGVIQPLHRRFAMLTTGLPFSLGEFLYAAVIGGVLIYIISSFVLMILRPARLRRLYRLCIWLIAMALSVYALFCLLWGVYYYGDDFLARSGLPSSPITGDALETVTLYFADRLNFWGEQVARDGDGLCQTDRAAVLRRSAHVFDTVTRQYPCLAGPAVPAKGMFFSRILSLMDFTGFFCPFTAEANVNTDFPVGLFAATVAHELSHQRGVAREEEANFVAVLAALESGDADYCYSACMLAYVHLGNALAGSDPAAYRLIYGGLTEDVKRDLRANNAYWAQFDTPVQTVTNAVYEGFLQSYDQSLGMRSYGACVDLLVNYYHEAALTHFAPGQPKA